MPPAAAECLRRPDSLLTIRRMPFGLYASQVAVAVLPMVPAKGRPCPIFGTDAPIAGGAGSAASALSPVELGTSGAGGVNDFGAWLGFLAERAGLPDAFRTSARGSGCPGSCGLEKGEGRSPTGMDEPAGPDAVRGPDGVTKGVPVAPAEELNALEFPDLRVPAFGFE